MTEPSLPSTIGHYKIDNQLGQGGYATVFHAYDDTSPTVDIALKVLKKDWMENPQVIERFKTEANHAKKLDHPNIVSILDVGEADGGPFIAMKLAPGRSLQRMIAEDGRVPWPRALTILEQTAAALDYAHQQKVIHRDIKPANIIVDIVNKNQADSPVRVVLTDFGLAHGMEATVPITGSLSHIFGTPQYTPPEVWKDQEVTSASDIYALACVTYEMLTGLPLFVANNPAVIMTKHLMSEPEFPPSWPESVPDSVTEVLRKALSKDPGQRYQTAGEFVQALRICERYYRMLGHYKVKDELGHGDFATVYSAYDTENKREVALKILQPRWKDNLQVVEQFKTGAKAAISLKYSHIVSILDVGEANRDSFIAMELAPGQSLKSLIATDKPLWPRILTILEQAAAALDYAHGQEKIHGDLKPANILVDVVDKEQADSPVRVALTDFGLTRGLKQAAVSQTGSGVNFIGTPHYTPPEVWKGQPATSASDIYALACVAYEMFTGQPLFEAGNPTAVMAQHLMEEPKFPPSWGEGVPDGVTDVLRQALSKKPEQRHKTAGELSQALRACERHYRLVGHYKVKQELGHGDFATVYSAYDTEKKREVALKVLQPSRRDNSQVVERFKAEAKAAMILQHSKIIAILDVDEADGNVFMAMELTPGRSLQSIIAKDKPLAWSRALTILEQAAAALDYAHQHQVIHRDLKPADILVDENQAGGAVRVALTDFGLARGLKQAAVNQAGGSVNLIGTPYYTPPEVWEGQSATSASDIYALACVAYEMFIGQPLFKADNPTVVMTKHLKAEPEFPASWPEGVPNSITRVLRQALNKDPQQRYPTAGEFVQALHDCERHHQMLGRYKIKDELGQGDFAIVYSAYDMEKECEVALKVLQPRWKNNPQVVERFKAEANLAARVQHPNIVSILEVSEADGNPFIAMKLVPGQSLQSMIATDKSLVWSRALPILEQTAAALDCAHQHNVIHRDIKPANILVNERQAGGAVEVVLTDFGLARGLEQAAMNQAGSDSNAGNSFIGTPQYTPPEVWEGQPATSASDTYALACVAYEMFIGHPPFVDRLPVIMTKHLKAEPEFPANWPLTVPDTVTEVLRKALKKDPLQRYQTAGELVQALRACERHHQMLGHYKIKDELGHGDFATVYRAYDTEDKREVALKVLQPHWQDTPQVVERFKTEAQVALSLTHPNIVSILDVGEADKTPFIAMELAPGRSLQNIIAADKPLSWSRALTILEQTAAALDYAHQQPMPHGDLKPADIIVDEPQAGGPVAVALTNFSLARGLKQAVKASSGNLIGTPQYTSPEIWKDQPATPASDIYALACVAHEMLIGYPPFKADNPALVAPKHLSGKPEFPANWPADMPTGVKGVLRKALEINPQQRYQTAGELVQALRDCEAPKADRWQAEAKTVLLNLKKRLLESRQSLPQFWTNLKSGLSNTAHKLNKTIRTNPKRAALIGLGVIIALILLLLFRSGNGAVFATPTPTFTVAPTSLPITPTDTPTPASMATPASPTSTLRVLQLLTLTATPTPTLTETPIRVRLTWTHTPTLPPCQEGYFWDPILKRCRLLP